MKALAMPPSPRKKSILHVTIAEQVVRAETYIAHMNETIRIMQRCRNHSEDTLIPAPGNDEMMAIVLKVLGRLEDHHRILLDLQEGERKCTSSRLPVAAISHGEPNLSRRESSSTP